MITHDHKLIFIHIPKCAGRSVSEIFNQRFDQYTGNYYYQTYNRFWNEYDKFAIVRNPYARLVSIYHYIQEHRRHAKEEIGFIYGGSKAPLFNEWVINNFRYFKGLFDLNSPEAERGGDWQIGSSHWFSPQSRFIMVPGERMVPNIKIFRMEDGFDQINEWLKKRGVTIEIPHVNKSNHKPYREYYNEDLLQFLSYQYFIHDDCKYFNYTF